MLNIREFKDSDELGIRSLFVTCFGKELSHGEWHWKYKESPWGATASIAMDNEEIIAHYGGLRAKFFYQDKIFDALQPCDVMTHPKFRARIFSKRGAMVKAGEHFYSNNHMDFAFGFPSERHAILGTKQLGYTEHRYITVLRKSAAGLKKTLILPEKVQKGWDSISAKEIDSICKEVKGTAGLTIIKDSHYLFWRYRDNPIRRYLPLMVRTWLRNKLKAFVIISFRDSELLIQDFFHTDAIDIKNLFKLLEKIALEHRLQSIVAWVNPNEPVFKAFIDYGFVADKGIPYLFRVINAEVREEFLFNNYCYRMGDYDSS